VLVEEGTISKEDLQLFRYVDTPEAAWREICDFYQLGTPPTRDAGPTETQAPPA
jgi:predicted Rossmann-fold nucleotide-binding protein